MDVSVPDGEDDADISADILGKHPMTPGLKKRVGQLSEKFR